MKLFNLDNKLAKSMFVFTIVLPFLIFWQAVVELWEWIISLF